MKSRKQVLHLSFRLIFLKHDVANPYLASQLDFSELRLWNQAPTNLKVLSDNGVVFALTTDKLKKNRRF
jgi:hypothetical protein